MGRYLLRRLANYLVLVIVAASLTYFLAGLSLNPRAKFEGRNPPLPASSITKTLDDYNMNPDTPILSRFGHWAKGVVHGDLGKTIEGDDVNDDFGRRVGVSTRLLLIATIIGSIGGVALGAFGAIRQYRSLRPLHHPGLLLRTGHAGLRDRCRAEDRRHRAQQRLAEHQGARRVRRRSTRGSGISKPSSTAPSTCCSRRSP